MDICGDIYKKWNERFVPSIIGRTRLNAPIYMYSTGSDTLIVASVHAREYITSLLVTELFCNTKYSFDVIPILNVDGVRMCVEGVDWIEEPLRSRLVELNGSDDFRLWKANAFGVDINVNFDAEWGRGKSNIFHPSGSNYIGPYPESEPETRAIADLLRSGRYSQVVAYHSKGDVIYFGFGTNFYHRDLAGRYSRIVDYPLTYATGSAGGLKDYFDTICPGLGLTVEVGEDKFDHPYPLTELDNLISKHLDSVEILYENGKEVAARILGRGIRRS